MLRSPRRLPQRFNRKVTPQTRRLVERRHQRRRQYLLQRWQRAVQRLQRRAGNLKKVVMQFAALVTGGVLLLLIGLALFSPILHIREIRIARSDPRIDADAVQQALSPLFGEHLFFLSTQEVADLLDGAVADMREAEITKQYPSTLQIRITLDPIVAQLTIDTPNTVNTGSGAQTGSGDIAPKSTTVDYLTSGGLYVVYNKSQIGTASGLLQLKVVDWEVRPEPWKAIVDAEFLDVMRAAENELKTQFGLSVRTRSVYLRAREFHLLTKDYSLWFDMRSPLPEQLQRYRLFLQSTPPGSAKEYIDLRLKDKIVYK